MSFAQAFVGDEDVGALPGQTHELVAEDAGAVAQADAFTPSVARRHVLAQPLGAGERRLGHRVTWIPDGLAEDAAEPGHLALNEPTHVGVG